MHEDLKISKNIVARNIWLLLGFLSTGLGIMGYIIPIMPGTTFIIIALYCFAKSNKKWHDKLLNNKYFGQTLRDFKAGKGMTKKAKISALICIILSISISLYFASNVWVSVFLLTCGVFAVYMVLKQKTKCK